MTCELGLQAEDEAPGGPGRLERPATVPMPMRPITYVIAIEQGVGEPTSIPFAIGQVVQPISVGRKGAWRIESEHVADVHAFLYFDGDSLFLASAGESIEVLAGGDVIGTTWTKLCAPCTITLGAAALCFRSLSAAIAEKPPPPPPSFERPFRPGEFARSDPDEVTRVSPLRAPVARVLSAGTPSMSIVPTSDPRLEDTGIGDTRHQGSTGSITSSGLGPNESGAASPLLEGPAPDGPPPAPIMSVHFGRRWLDEPGLQPQDVTGSGPYGWVGTNSAEIGTTAKAVGRTDPVAEARYYIAKYKELSLPKRVLVFLGPLSLLAAAYLLLLDDEPRPSRDVASLSAGGDAGSASSKAIASSAPLEPGCPPGFVRYAIPSGPTGVIACVPVGTPMPPPSEGALTNPPPPVADVAPAAAGVASAATTLERDAVDAIAVNDYARAAALYEQLRQQHPTTRAYAEAARILSAKADAGAP
ncbi:MAG: hypothetical protein K0S65_4442 [Labilithrix sp.]|nr:hypothetical protein [Labilithrix sp.]